MITRYLRILSVSCVVAAGAFPHHAKAVDFFSGSVDGIDLKDAGDTDHWAIFSLGGNIGISDASYNASFNDVIGTVGSAGSGNLTVSAGRVDGDAWLHTGGKKGLSGGAVITGHVFQDSAHDAILNQAVTDATNASATANSLAATAGSPTTISLSNSSATYSALSLGTNGTYVMKLTDFVLGNSTITLDGTSTEHFVIDVSRYFLLSGASQVVLEGGLTAQDVLFNVTGTNSVSSSLSGASKLSGIILAANRTVTLSGGSVVNGEIIAQTVTLSGSSQVRNPTFSP
jgi:hypothetical protein